MKFAHAPTFDQQKGRIKVYCACGVQSGRLYSWEEAQEAYEEHALLMGLREKQKLR